MPVDDHSFDYQIGKFTSTCANVVMNATSEAALNKFWRVKVGYDAPDPPNWAMRAGSHMESLVLDWLQEQTDTITRRGEVVDHPNIADVCVKLDGYRAADDAVIEVKFLAPWRNKEEFLPAFYAQTMLQRLCTGAKNAMLVVAQGTSEPTEFPLEFDSDYAAELMRRAEAFLHSMRTLTEPYPQPPIVPRDKWRTLDIIKEPTNWSPELLLYLQEYDSTATAAALHDEMGKAARDLIPDDVGKVFAGAFQIARNRKGTLAITRRAA